MHFKKFVFLSILCAGLCLAFAALPSRERRELRQLAPDLCQRTQTLRESYTLLPDTDFALRVTALQGAQSGKSVYIVAGLHGDEQAAWQAGNLLKEMDLAAGQVWVLSPANPYGAAHDQRTTRSGRDANRWFGSNTDWDAAVLDRAIAADINEKQPDLILDLHEAHENARQNQDRYDALGNSLVCYSLESIGDTVLDFLQATENAPGFSAPFTLYSSPPAGSLNDYAGRVLGISTITVETWRGEELSSRVQTQLRTVAFFLRKSQLIA